MWRVVMRREVDGDHARGARCQASKSLAGRLDERQYDCCRSTRVQQAHSFRAQRHAGRSVGQSPPKIFGGTSEKEMTVGLIES